MPPQPTSRSSILILSSHLNLGLPSVLFPTGFPTVTVHTSLLSLIRIRCPANLILLDLIILIIMSEKHRSTSSSLCSVLNFSFTSSLSGPNIFRNTLFSNTVSLRSSLNVGDQVSHSYKTTGKIIVLYILCVESNQIKSATTHKNNNEPPDAKSNAEL